MSGVTAAAVGAATEEKLGHRPGLDGLRGVAILLVMLAHAEMPGMASGGIVGVTLFFALSGFLITSILRGERELDLRRFYVRRARRLLPALVALMVAVAAVGRLTVEQAAVTGLYIGNWSRAAGHSLGLLNHVWSLAIEEQFYLVWPLVLVALGARAWAAAVVGIVVAVAARIVLWQSPADTDFVYFSTLTRIDAVLAGCLLAFVAWRPGRWWPVALVGLAGLSAVTSSAFAYRYGLTLAAVLAVVAVAGATDTPWVMAHPVLRWFGQRSYGLYLWHTAATFYIDPVTAVGRAAVFAAGLAIAELSWRFIEEPFLASRRQSASFANQRSASVADACSSE